MLISPKSGQKFTKIIQLPPSICLLSAKHEKLMSKTYIGPNLRLLGTIEDLDIGKGLQYLKGFTNPVKHIFPSIPPNH